MTDISETLLNFFLNSASLIEVDPQGKTKNYDTLLKIVKEEAYVPLITVDKIKFIKNFNMIENLKKDAEAVLEELGIKTDLPPTYKFSITFQLSILEAWRKYIQDKIVIDKRFTLRKDKLGEVNISFFSLIYLYRFIVLTKFASTGTQMVELFERILEDPYVKRRFPDTYDEIKNLYEFSKNTNKKRGDNRKAYTQYNTLYIPLVLSYLLNGAGLMRYYNMLRNSKSKSGSALAYGGTILMDLLSEEFFRIIYLNRFDVLKQYANRLVKYFSVLHSVLERKDLASVLKNMELYYVIMNEAFKNGMNEIDTAITWDLTNNALLSMLISLKTNSETKSKEFEQLLEVYKEKVGEVTLEYFVTKTYGFTY